MYVDWINLSVFICYLKNSNLTCIDQLRENEVLVRGEQTQGIPIKPRGIKKKKNPSDKNKTKKTKQQITNDFKNINKDIKY